MKRLLPFLLSLVLFSLVLTGCFEEMQDGYQLGDITRMSARELANLEQSRQKYCTATSGSTLKKAALLAIRTQLPGYPAEGICSFSKPSDTDKRTGTVEISRGRLISFFMGYDPPDPLPA